MLQLHYFPGNASLIPHILLEELGVPFRLKLVDRTVNAQKSPAHLQLNPNGTIPVLVDGDLVLYETAAICLHLADTNLSAGLAPVIGTAERAQCYKWLMWMTNTVQAALLQYFYPERWVDTGSTAGAAQIKAHAESKIGGMLDQMDAQVAANGGAWFQGSDKSVLDPYALVLSRWTRGFGRPARALPHLGPYLQQLLERPAVQRAFASEKLARPYI